MPFLGSFRDSASSSGLVAELSGSGMVKGRRVVIRLFAVERCKQPYGHNENPNKSIGVPEIGFLDYLALRFHPSPSNEVGISLGWVPLARGVGLCSNYPE